MYEDAFETKFLKATEALYHEEGNRYMQETDVSYHLFQYLYPRGWMGSKKLNSSLPFVQPALKVGLPWASESLLIFIFSSKADHLRCLGPCLSGKLQ